MMQQENIQWTRLSSIVAVQGVMTLTWVIYALYLPKLLTELGFAKELASTILIIEHFLEVAIEPAFGFLSDRQQVTRGNRFPYITIGIVLASSFFLALPIITFFFTPESQLRWLLPILAVLWASAMAIFRSPVLALLTQVTPQPQLPIAVSFLTFIQQLVNSLRFNVFGLILKLGPLFAFAIGSFSLLIAGAFLRKIMPVYVAATPQTPKSISSVSPRKIITIVTTAIAIGFGLRFLFSILPQVFTSYFGKEFVPQGMLIFSLLLAFIALPAGKLATKIGYLETMMIALITTAMGLTLVVQSLPVAIIILLLIILAGSFTTVLNSMMPFVLNLVPSNRAGFGIGCFFGGFGGAISFYDLLINTKADLHLLGIQAMIAFLIACLVVSFHYFSSATKTN
jgi:Na+/melibiose symporter-like transporter